MTRVTHMAFWRLAVPFTLSTVTQPLLGAVDTAVVGRLGSPDFIGGVAVGTVIFNTLYWLFGFLRVATSGFAAQTLGGNQPRDTVLAWLRPIAIAAVAGLVFVLCQQPILRAAQMVYQADPVVAGHAAAYYGILIWGAPLVLIGMVNLGWLMGRGHAREVLILQMGTNVLNILLDLIFVLFLKAGVPGVAVATLIAQGLGFGLGTWMVMKKIPLSRIRCCMKGVFDPGPMKKLAVMNRDLFIRTACLLTMTNLFVAKGAAMGTDILAANAILFQIQYLIAYLFDGLANAASVLAGRAAGKMDMDSLKQVRQVCHVNTAILGLALMAGLAWLGTPLLGLFTDMPQVLAVCRRYLVYLLVFVPAMAPGLVYFGFFVGATCSAPVRNSLVLALLVFVPAQMALIPCLGNHGLWIAFILFCMVRSLVLVLSWDRLAVHVAGAPGRQGHGRDFAEN